MKKPTRCALWEHPEIPLDQQKQQDFFERIDTYWMKAI
jgi:hypothetical protein